MSSSLAPGLLVAMPDLADPNFRRAVVLLVHHDEDGTVGLILNRPSDVLASSLCETLEIPWNGDPEQSVYWGGPVQPSTGWIVAGESALEGLDECTAFAEGMHFAGSLEALRRVAGSPPIDLRLFLGYAGWAPGQLEAELTQGAWVVAPFGREALFDVEPEALWDHVWALLGIDPSTVVSTPGVH